jgi:hypothetical protein
MPKKVDIPLPRDQFELVLEDEHFIAIRDKVVDKVYTYNKQERGWKFPQGSRSDVIFYLTGYDPGGKLEREQ